MGGCSVARRETVGENFVFERKGYICEVPFAKLSFTQCPCIDIEIESKRFTLELDLGFRGDISLGQEQMDTVLNKQYLFDVINQGLRGKKYSKRVFQIPKLKIGNISFFKPNLEEEKSEFVKDSTFIENGEELIEEDGRLGWELFQGVNVFIDVKNNRIVFCDSLFILLQQGYLKENYVKTPMILENGLVQIKVDTDKGDLYCMLDTGSTWNVLNQELKVNKSLDEAVWDSKNIEKLSRLKIGEANFGSFDFQCIPLNLPFRVDAILGMEFFKEAMVFLDFQSKCAYFSKN